MPRITIPAAELRSGDTFDGRSATLPGGGFEDGWARVLEMCGGATMIADVAPGWSLVTVALVDGGRVVLDKAKMVVVVRPTEAEKGA